ncbi:putative fungal pheromone GPCR, STE3-type [Daedalea quercina L-15889]|uniref:Putative fungal pheromone GPCR, STE3-type n=1 Tax=Daedalea quercina L-15889 TaxID=1314783 RepID=A0A165QFH7_9APHY|nr:putative fungal pheromone GPCR, STE3-type [Daedalea quercina L-15889]
MGISESAYPLFPTFAFFGFVVGLIPLPWHLQGWNAGTCIYMLWVSLASLVEFVDSIVWNANINDPAPVWCDISTKFLIGAGIGIPAASLCINRRLYRISRMSSATISRQERLRAVYEDVTIAIGIPVLVMILHYVVQGHRYNILEDVGCTPVIFNTALAYPLVLIWPILLGCVSFVYAGLTLRAFWRRRAQFQQFISSNSALTTNRYLRLMLLCCVEMALTVPLNVFSIYENNLDNPIQPYVSWENVHYGFSLVEKFPAVLWMSNRAFYTSTELGRWVYPCSAILFFALFGFAEEARRNYSLAFWAIAKRIGFHPPTEKASALRSFRLGSKKDNDFAPSSPSETLPPYTPRGKRPQRSRSFSSSFLDSVIDIDIDYDIEKGAESTTVYGSEKPANSPAATSATLSLPESAVTALPKAPSEKFCAMPPLSPETPSYPLTAATTVPPYHRPFASISDPVSPSKISALGAQIQVSMHQEVTKVAESP